METITGWFNPIASKWADAKQKQSIAIQCLMEAAQVVPQGAALGAGSFYLNKNVMEATSMNPNATPEARAQIEKMQALQPKTLVASMRNFVVLFAVQAGLTKAFKHYRKDKDDVWNTAGPAFGAGLAFALASGGPPDNLVTMSCGFAAFSALFYKIGEWTGTGASAHAKGPEAEMQYSQSLHMLTGLGLARYHKNIQKGLLTDPTIMLWTEPALAECRIPPGPRLLILHHLAQASKLTKSQQGKFLSPAHPIDVPANYQPAGTA